MPTSSDTTSPETPFGTTIGTGTVIVTPLGLNETGAPTPSNLQGSSRFNYSFPTLDYQTLRFSVLNSHKSMAPIIAGVVVGVLTVLSVIAILIFLQRRKNRRNRELMQTFASARVDLDGAAADDANEMAIPEPYVYRPVTRGHSTNLVSSDPESPRQNSTPSPQSVESPLALAARKGERYLPKDTTSSEDNNSGGPSQTRIQEEDIDRLAAKMVAMMSSGRLVDQAWAPRAQNNGFDAGDDLPAAPPQYKDVARRSSGAPPSGGR